MLDGIAVFASFMGGPGVVAVALALVAYVFVRGPWRDAAIIAIGIVVAEVLDLVLKEVFDRVRPELWLRAAVELFR